jgi:hypothetical protein
MNPSRPNDNLEGEAKCYSSTLQSKGPGLSFLGSLIHTGDEILTERRDRDSGRECWICQTHAGMSGFPVESGEVVWVFGLIRPKNPRSVSLSGRIQREIRPEYHVFRPVLSSFIFLCRRPVCVGDRSFFLSLFLRRRPDLSSSFLLCRQPVYEPIEYQKTIQIILISFNIKKLINIKNNRNKRKKLSLDGFGQNRP